MVGKLRYRNPYSFWACFQSSDPITFFLHPQYCKTSFSKCIQVTCSLRVAARQGVKSCMRQVLQGSKKCPSHGLVWKLGSPHSSQGSAGESQIHATWADGGGSQHRPVAASAQRPQDQHKALSKTGQAQPGLAEVSGT